MARETKNPSKPKARGRAADGFVMMAMALVTLALGVGLVLQAGLSVTLAATVSVAFYMGLLSLHTLARRHDQLDQLKSEIENLKGEVARLGGASTVVAADNAAMRPAAPGVNAAGGPAGGPTVGTTTAKPGHARPGSTAAPTAPPTAPPQDAAHRNAAQKPAAPKSAELNEAAAKGAIANEAAAREDAARSGRPAAAPAMYLGVPQPPPPSVVRAPQQAPQQANAARPAMPSAARPGQRDVDADTSVTNAHAAAPAVGSINRVPRNPVPAMPPAAAPRATPHAEGKSNESLAGAERRGSGRAPVVNAAVAPPMSASAEQALPRDGDARDQAWAYRPGDEMQPAGFSPRESDVEMIQGLIKKLADEVNAADAGKLASVAAPAMPPRRAIDEDRLDQSVGALRRTAQTMKAPAFERTEVAAAMPPARDEADFDVDALMRRAEPIASMTSMPPPLPMASNALSHAPGRDGVKDRAAFDVDTAHEIAAFEAERRQEMASLGTRAATPRHELPDAIEAPVADEADGARRDGVDMSWAEADDDANMVDERRAALADAMLNQIADAIEAGRVDVYLEPILDLGKQQPQHYEVSLSLRDAGGSAIAIDDDGEAEYPSGALPLLDSLRLSRTSHVARRLEERNKAGSVFSTFSGQSLTSDDFLTTFADTYDANMGLAGQLILTFSQADVRRFRAPHWAMLSEMRELGFGFAVRALTDLDMDFAQLSSAGFRFAKLDAAVFLQGLPAPGAVVSAADLCKYLAGEGLALVVESIDDDAKRARVFGFGALLGQGALFGGPRLMKAAAVSGARSAAA